MALREFIDRTGCRWRVWDIRPEELHPATRAEDYLQTVIHGWLAFEPAGGGEKRRLSPIPRGWENATEADLESMLQRADPVGNEGGAAVRGEATPSPRDAPPTAAVSGDAPTLRVFRYPNGRYWTVNEQPTETTASGRQHSFLRFTSGARSLETSDGPSGWARMSEDELAELLYRSFPREAATDNPTRFRRRRHDGA
jgi:hypothetical protein